MPARSTPSGRADFPPESGPNLPFYITGSPVYGLPCKMTYGKACGPKSKKPLRPGTTRQSWLAARVAGPGVGGGELAALKEKPEWWIPGVEVFSRRVFQQRQRGHFGEFAREGEGKLGEIGMWPKQWASALMFSRTAKGFHIHPPKIPAGTTPEAWFQRLFVTEPANHAPAPVCRTNNGTRCFSCAAPAKCSSSTSAPGCRAAECALSSRATIARVRTTWAW